MPSLDSLARDRSDPPPACASFCRILHVWCLRSNLVKSLEGFASYGKISLQAYGFLMVEALADAGVRAGLPRPTALVLAAQTLKGAATMVLEGGKHPGELKDQA